MQWNTIPDREAKQIMWESIGLLFLYLISGYLNKRKKDKKNREIESDPNWDIPEKEEGIDDLLLNLFNQNETSSANVEFKSSDGVDVIDQAHEEVSDDQLTSSEEEISPDRVKPIINSNKEQNFEDKIYHSKLADRSELHLGNKWKRKKSIKKILFNSPNSLKRAFVLKEILDNPVALKKQS